MTCIDIRTNLCMLTTLYCVVWRAPNSPATITCHGLPQAASNYWSHIVLLAHCWVCNTNPWCDPSSPVKELARETTAHSLGQTELCHGLKSDHRQGTPSASSLAIRCLGIASRDMEHIVHNTQPPQPLPPKFNGDASIASLRSELYSAWKIRSQRSTYIIIIIK